MGNGRILTKLLAAVACCIATLPASTAAAAPGDPPGAPGGGVRRLGDVIPVPVEVRADWRAQFRLRSDAVIRADAGARAVGDLLAQTLRSATGYALPVVGTGGYGPAAIWLRLGGADPRLGEEGYRLDVARTGITIRARTAAGLFAGTQTVRQLFPAEIESSRPVRRDWTVPGGTIVDFPRFAYRSAMLDLARHFHTADEVKRYIDEIAQFKINHVHLHLADDQGWRIQIDSWPNLTVVGGGPGTGVGGVGPGYLTKAEYTDLVAYAAARFVTVVPEIDMPGHTNAALSTYAELNCNGIAPPPRTDTAVGYSSLCIGKEITYRFVDDVIRELAAITPGPFLHIGGDEAHATTDEEYRTFMNRVIPIVGRYGKRIVGWHEIATVNPPTSAVPQFWDTATTNQAVADAAARGNKIVISPANKAYLDMKYNASTPLGLDWAGYIEVRDAYEWNPGSHVTGVGETAVLGVEAPLWSETLRTLDDIEFMAFPRLAAIAELGWSTQGSHNWDAFRARLGQFGPRWTLQGVDFYRSSQVPWS
jgi:hexosaminidase